MRGPERPLSGQEWSLKTPDPLLFLLAIELRIMPKYALLVEGQAPLG